MAALESSFNSGFNDINPTNKTTVVVNGGPIFRPTRIAIIGGGLAGASAAGALSRLPNVDVKLYERSDAVREVGALIAVMVSGVRALSRMLSPKGWKTLQHILYRGEETEGIHHRHWRTGEIMATASSAHTARPMQEGRTGRVALLEMLMNEIPDGIPTYGRKVMALKKLETGMQVQFADGKTEDADLVVAADGLYSRIRKQYVPNDKIAYRGQVAYRYNFPDGMVSHIKAIKTDTSVWKKDGDSVFLSRLEPGIYSFVAFLREEEEHANGVSWALALGKPGIERLKKKLIGWDPVIHEVLDILPDINGYPLQASPWMESLIRDNGVAFIGDAAHPTAGAYGMGSSFAFCDVRALYLSLEKSAKLVLRASSITTSGAKVIGYDIPYALHLYDETRRYFLQRVQRQLSHDQLDLKYVAEAGDETEALRRYRETFTINWWMLEHDVDARWQEVECQERHRRLKPVEDLELKFANRL